MSRAQVRECLLGHGVEVTAENDEFFRAPIEDQELAFWFSKDGSERLLQIATDAEETNWGGQPLIGARLERALRSLAPKGAVVWQATDVMMEPFPSAGPVSRASSSDEALLESGTVWLLDRSLGLAICEGEVIAVVWRERRDLPTTFAGAVTQDQRELSLRADLAQYLIDKRRRARPLVSLVRGPLWPLRTAVTLLILTGLALVARNAWREMQLVAEAPVLNATFVGLEQGPQKQFFDYLPESITRHLPAFVLAGTRSGLRPQTELYRLELTNPAGTKEQVRLEAAEFYFPPSEPGESVEVVYLSSKPLRIKGPARARDAAVIDFLPLAISLGMLWLLAQGAISLLAWLLPILRLLSIGSRGTPDPDRPELR